MSNVPLAPPALAAAPSGAAALSVVHTAYTTVTMKNTLTALFAEAISPWGGWRGSSRLWGDGWMDVPEDILLA